jgi:hypothetical protein
VEFTFNTTIDRMEDNAWAELARVGLGKSPGDLWLLDLVNGVLLAPDSLSEVFPSKRFTFWCSDWTRPTNNDRVGLLWDADDGNLTVYVNGERKGIANLDTWCGEIRGELCWGAQMTITNAEDGKAQDASVRIQRLDPPRLTAAEEAKEKAEKARMALRLRVEQVWDSHFNAHMHV